LALCPRPKKAGARESRGEKRDPLDQFLEAASGDLSLSLSGLLRPDAVGLEILLGFFFSGKWKCRDQWEAGGRRRWQEVMVQRACERGVKWW
jgi:hypothetical protein